MGFIPFKSSPSSKNLNVNSSNPNVIKAVILGGLYPNVAKVHLPKSAIKFDKVQAGTLQRENTAKEFKIYDLHAPNQENARVFLHPGSVLFGEATWKSRFLVYFQKHQTDKVFLRDATEVFLFESSLGVVSSLLSSRQVPVYALLLFGGRVSINHVAGGLTVGENGTAVKFKAWPRIGILVNQLRWFGLP
jgi:ATP-dependent RNA helicase DHX57